MTTAFDFKYKEEIDDWTKAETFIEAIVELSSVEENFDIDYFKAFEALYSLPRDKSREEDIQNTMIGSYQTFIVTLFDYISNDELRKFIDIVFDKYDFLPIFNGYFLSEGFTNPLIGESTCISDTCDTNTPEYMRLVEYVREKLLKIFPSLKEEEDSILFTLAYTKLFSDTGDIDYIPIGTIASRAKENNNMGELKKIVNFLIKNKCSYIPSLIGEGDFDKDTIFDCIVSDATFEDYIYLFKEIVNYHDDDNIEWAEEIMGEERLLSIKDSNPERFNLLYSTYMELTLTGGNEYEN